MRLIKRLLDKMNIKRWIGEDTLVEVWQCPVETILLIPIGPWWG